MNRSDRLIYRELFAPFVVSITAFLLMLVGNTLYRHLETILREKWPIALVTRFLLLNIPTVLVMALPIAATLAISLAVVRMARDNEITALRSLGIPLLRTFLPIYLFGATIALTNFLIFEKVTPWAWREQQNTLAVLDALPTNPADASRRIQADNQTITFTKAERIGVGKRRIRQIVLVENAAPLPGGAAQTPSSMYPQITTAEYAEYANGVWTLTNVGHHRFEEDGLTQIDATAETGTLILNIDLSNAGGGATPLTSSFTYTLAELWTNVKQQVQLRNFKQAREFETDAHLKIAFPLQSLVFAFVAPLLSLRFARSGAFTGILLSLVLVVFALLLLLTLRVAAVSGYVPPLFAAWFPLVLLAGFGAWLHKQQE